MQYVHLFSAITNYIESIIVQGGYFILFVTTIFEGIPLVGMLVPGHVTIMIGGFVARLGRLDLVLVLIVSISGALIGDYMGFYIGKKYGMNFINKLRPYLFISDAQINRANSLLAKHTGKALVIGRFTPATRALMPFLVGTTHLETKRFWLFNIIGGIAWVTISVLIGFLFGSAYHIASGYVGKIILLSILASFIFIWGYRFINSRFHIFRKYELFTLILNIVALLIFATTLDKLIDGSFQLNFDVWVNLLMQNLNLKHVFFSGFAKIISNIGSVYTMAILGIIVAIYFAYNKKWRSSAIIFLTTTLTGAISGLMKTYFMSPRPINSIIVLSDPSFPSSHASMSAGILFAIIYLFAPRIHSWIRRESMIVISVLGIIAIGTSRLILNVHWFSDIIAGWSLGIFIATGSILLVKYISEILIRKN